MKAPNTVTMYCPAQDCPGCVEWTVEARSGSGAGGMTIDVEAKRYRTVGDHNHEPIEGTL